jgi:hypothetical protein
VCLLLDSPAKTIHDAHPSPPRFVVMALFSLGASLVGTSISLRSLATPALLVALKVFGNGFVCKRAATKFFGISADSSSYDMLTLYSSLPAAPIAWAIAREQVGSLLALQKDLIQVKLIGHRPRCLFPTCPCLSRHFCLGRMPTQVPLALPLCWVRSYAALPWFLRTTRSGKRQEQLLLPCSPLCKISSPPRLSSDFNLILCRR